MSGMRIELDQGFADMHVHLREPGATHKEDFVYGLRAAAAGGATAVWDMVNNPGNFTNSVERLEEKDQLATKAGMVVDLGRHYRYQPEEANEGTFSQASRLAFGLKSMLEISTGSDKQTPPSDFKDGWKEWHRVASPTQPIILHAETETIEEALEIAAGDIGHPTHVAHVSNRAEIEAVIDAKRKGWPVTAGITPHHLFMDSTDVESWFQRMKPPLARPMDVEFAWAHLDAIDVLETDHAPHTKDEKERANRENPEASEAPEAIKSYGVPGLEAVVPLMFTALTKSHDSGRDWRKFHGKAISMQKLISMLVDRPREILGMPHQSGTSVTVALGKYEFGQDNIYSKCGWSPYEGWLVNAKVLQVNLRGLSIYRNGRFYGTQGRVLRPQREVAQI